MFGSKFGSKQKPDWWNDILFSDIIFVLLNLLKTLNPYVTFYLTNRVIQFHSTLFPSRKKEKTVFTKTEIWRRQNEKQYASCKMLHPLLHKYKYNRVNPQESQPTMNICPLGTAKCDIWEWTFPILGNIAPAAMVKNVRNVRHVDKLFRLLTDTMLTHVFSWCHVISHHGR